MPFEVRTAFPTLDEGAEKTATLTGKSTLAKITSGTPSDSRESDERQEDQRLRDLRGRVKRVRAIVASTPGLAEVLASDWRRAARFYARFGITEAELRYGVPSVASVIELLRPSDAP